MAASDSFMERGSSTTAFGGFLTLPRVNRLEHLSCKLHFGARRYGEHIATE